MQAGWVILVLVGHVLAEDDFESGQVAAYLEQVHEDLAGLNQGSMVPRGHYLPVHFAQWDNLCSVPLVHEEPVLDGDLDPLPELMAALES